MHITNNTQTHVLLTYYKIKTSNAYCTSSSTSSRKHTYFPIKRSCIATTFNNPIINVHSLQLTLELRFAIVTAICSVMGVCCLYGESQEDLQTNHTHCCCKQSLSQKEGPWSQTNRMYQNSGKRIPLRKINRKSYQTDELILKKFASLFFQSHNQRNKLATASNHSLSYAGNSRTL